MITYEIEINRELVTIAGAPEMNVLSAILTAVGKLGAQSAGTRDEPDTRSIELDVGGMTSPSNGSEEESVKWVARELSVGDEVVIRIRESNDAHEPVERRSAEVAATVERAMFKHARATYLRLRKKYENDESALAHDADTHALHGIQPVHRVRDVNTSVAYYRDVLGFEIDFVQGDPPAHARVSSGDRTNGTAVRIRFEQLARDAASSTDAGYCYIHVGHDLDGLCQWYRSRGATILREPESHPWGLRDFYVRDCDGYVLCFAGELRDD
jgi:catechol 2,3-dioxygenase-like lactoylglutathione lyase family enzyme